jgi:hypothetical protein
MGILLPQGFHRDEKNDFPRAPAESVFAMPEPSIPIPGARWNEPQN